MRISTLFTAASLFLIGSYSLPRPENLEPSRTIEDREAHVAPGAPFASHIGGAEWWKDRKSGGETPASNGTKLKEREAHHERPISEPSGLPEFFEHRVGGSGTPSTNETKIKEREAHHERPISEPSGLPESFKHRVGGSGTPSTNDTKIKEREAHHERPTSEPSGLPEFFEHRVGGSNTPSTNGTKIKEREAPPDGMTWMEFMKHKKHKGGSPSHGAFVPLSTGTPSKELSRLSTSGTETGGTNSTKVRMMKFRG
ncbi:hypothetical protein HO133_006157 [Letharia lupina]|uniref:Uncharacterized protein n=1 Tax=Letharia lupina TaxID=560253 RepID=A0A8H6F7U6_9LECA|nr:uncharacterized protein HO133_006157 [Letharia lupina]KAF6218196.1 hypothetical protein HO133_006157 [Letharia lupina]